MRVASVGAGVDMAERPVGMARLTASVPARVSRHRALSMLDRPGRNAWLGEVVEPSPDGGAERHLVDLELRVGEHTPRVTFRKAAYVDMGPVRARSLQPIEVGISWRAAGLAPLFPVFSGTLRWADRELSIDGYYAPPGGAIGIMADQLVLNVAARGTARLLLEKIAAAMRDAP
jgi:hypothetical protein